MLQLVAGYPYHATDITFSNYIQLNLKLHINYISNYIQLTFSDILKSIGIIESFFLVSKEQNLIHLKVYRYFLNKVRELLFLFFSSVYRCLTLM